MPIEIAIDAIISSTAARQAKELNIISIIYISVSDPSHFDVDPDPDPVPGIHIWEKWIRIRILGSTFP